MAAEIKFSQINSASSPPALTDTLVGVGGGTTDLQYTFAQAALTVGGQPAAGASLNFYVATTGSDSNPGTLGSPFATIQHALTVASQYDYQNIYSPTINVADGTYSPSVNTCPELRNANSAGTIIGNAGTPGNVILDNVISGQVAFALNGSLNNWNIGGIQFNSSNYIFYLTGGALVNVNQPIVMGSGSPFLCGANGLATKFFSQSTISFVDTLPSGLAVVQGDSNFTLVAATLVLQPNTTWQGTDTANQYGSYNFIFNSITNKATATGGALDVGQMSLFNSFTGLSTDLPYTGPFTIDNTSSISAAVTGPLGGFGIGLVSGNPTAFQPNIFTVVKDTSAPAGASNRMMVNDAGTYVVIGSGAPYKISIPTTGGTVTSSQGLKSNIFNPAGTLATLTVNLPTGMINGETTRISTSQTITAITFATTDSSAIVGAPATLVAGTAVQFLFDPSAGANGTWYIN